MQTMRLMKESRRILPGLVLTMLIFAVPLPVAAAELDELAVQYGELDMSPWFEWNAMHGCVGPQNKDLWTMPQILGMSGGGYQTTAKSHQELLFDSLVNINGITLSWADQLSSELALYYSRNGTLPENGLELAFGRDARPEEPGEALKQLQAMQPGAAATRALLAFNPATGKYIDSFDNPQWKSLAIHVEHGQGNAVANNPPGSTGLAGQSTFLPELRIEIYGQPEGSTLYSWVFQTLNDRGTEGEKEFRGNGLWIL